MTVEFFGRDVLGRAEAVLRRGRAHERIVRGTRSWVYRDYGYPVSWLLNRRIEREYRKAATSSPRGG